MYFIDVMLHIISIQNVKYWYEICDALVPIFTCCEELVPIFHNGKFAKCEICASAKRRGAKQRSSAFMLDSHTPILLRLVCKLASRL